MMGANVVLILGFVTAVLTTVALVGSRFRPGFVRYARFLSIGSAGLYMILLAYLGFQFLTTDYTNGYVWNHTAEYLPPFYRITGVFAGIEGSLLLWTTFVAMAVAWLLNRRVDHSGGRLVGTIAMLVLVYLGAVLLFRTPFQPLSLSGGTYVYGPRGLNPLLTNPYMAIHPPVTFLAYALTTVPFAISLAHFTRRLRGMPGIFHEWIPITIQWVRSVWVLLTAAVGLGALWSYTTLGWGGLWAWDPVETGILVTWLFVTAALHALRNTQRRGHNLVLAGALTGLTFPAVVFARYVTIGGFSDLHAFGLGSTTPTLVLLSVTSTIAIGLPLLSWFLETETGDTASPSLLSVEMGVFLSVLSLLGLSFVYGWGIILPRLLSLFSVSVVSVTTDFFNTWTYPFVVLLLLLLGALNDLIRRGRRFWLPLTAVVVATLAIAVVPMPDWQFGVTDATGYYAVLSSINSVSLLPPALYAIVSSLLRLRQELTGSEEGKWRKSLGSTLIHVGIALLIISAPFTYLGASSGTYVVPVESDAQLSIQTGDLSLAVQNTDIEYQKGGISVSDSERAQLIAGIEKAGYPAAQLPEATGGNILVWGEVTAVESTNSLVRYHLSDSDVWVETLSEEAPIEPDTVGTDETVLYVQGPVNDTGPNETVVRSDGQFLGLDPLDAIVPKHRVASSHIDLTVSNDDRLLASGRASIYSHYQYGVVTNVLLDRGIRADTYVIPNQLTSVEGVDVAVIAVKRIPMMSFVRLSILLLVLGGALQLYYGPRTVGVNVRNEGSRSVTDDKAK